jgi:galactokinase
VSRPRTWRAPGRVNLIGEHTDYNLGFVLPVALHLECRVTTEPSSNGTLHLASEQEKETREWPPAEVPRLKAARHWSDYVVGVAQQLAQAGFTIPALNLKISSTVPVGAGLSSSAALEVSSALALLDGQSIDKLQLAKLCQRAENQFVGMPSGIMDQYVAVFGEEQAAIEIDCRSLEHRAVRLPDDVAFLAVNSMVKHELTGSAYRQRTEECAEAVRLLGERFPDVKSLRDARLEQLQQVSLPAVVARRARHVVSEDARVEQFMDAARQSDVQRMGKLFVESHRSLQHDYEVSCAELDFLVDTALTIEGVHGARMTGGGFGGCTVNMLRPDAVEPFGLRLTRAYEERFGVTPQIYPVRPSAGAGEVPAGA